MVEFAKTEHFDVQQSIWGFGGLDCVHLPGDPKREKNALWDVLNLEWEGESLAVRYGYSEYLAAAITGTPTVTGIYQLRLNDTSTYILYTYDDTLYANGDTHTLRTIPVRSPAFASYKDVAVICNDRDVPHYYDPSASTTIGDLITDYPTGYGLTNFWPDVVCVCQTRLFMALNKIVFWGPIDSYSDWNTSSGADDAGYQPIDCRGRITGLIPWHDAEVIIMTDAGERYRLILGDADQTGFYIKELPRGFGCIKDTPQPIGSTALLFADRMGIHNLLQEEFAGNLRSFELSKNIRPIFSGGRLVNRPFRISEYYNVNWRSLNYASKSQYWLAVSEKHRTDNNYVIVLDYAITPPKLTIFKFNDVITSMATVYDTTEKEIVLFGSNNGMIYKYGYQIWSDNANAYTKTFDIIVDFENPRQIDTLFMIMMHLVETGDHNITVTSYPDFFKSGYSESTTLNCLSKSDVLGTGKLGTMKIGRREVIHKQLDGFKRTARFHRIRFQTTADNEYWIINGLDAFGKKDRIIGES